MNMRRVVVTGMGAVTPIGNTVDELWNNLVAGKSGAAPITKFDTTNFKTKFACEVKNFDPQNFMERNEARKMDLFTQFAFGAVAQCMADSKLDLASCDVKRVGVLWATGVGGIQTIEDEYSSFLKSGNIPRFSPFFIIKMIPNIAAGQISIKYGLKGVSYSTVSACTSSNNAITEAFNLIRIGKANVILAGGSEAPITQTSIGGFNALRALSERNDSPETASRPFDKSRDGFVMGEGAGVLMLEELEHALKRGARIYCEVGGYGCASDAYHITAPHPEGEGAVTAMLDAIDEAGFKTEDVDYINAHATSTPIGDPSECIAICKVFEKSLGKLHVSGTKSMTGHLLGAAGAVEGIASVLSIYNGIVPPTINIEEIDPVINPALNLTPNKAVKKDLNVVLNNTFGFGGHIVVSLFKKYKG
ncbi:MAG TPA: beta-ketoacyl-ACP synthase II [Bacteroidales bacterium]|nr:beta-ketoacyl-ACP synthase II [Bacteroidales bacterium]